MVHSRVSIKELIVMFFKQIYSSGLSIHSYLLGDEKTKSCIVIDPTRHVVPYIVEVQSAGLDIIAILETHVHADFVSGAKELKHQLNEKPQIYASGMGGKEWVPSYVDHVVMQETQLQIGVLRLKAVHTPGHTPEHVTWVCYDESRSSQTPWFAFTGDCLFVGSVGRPDLLGKSETEKLASQLYRTLFETLDFLPDFVEIFPSHGQDSLCGKALKARSTSTMGYERLFNTYLKKESKDLWIKRLQKNELPIPPYFQRLKKMNVEGPPLLSSLKIIKWEDGQEDFPLNELFLLDVRHPDAFASSHLKGSLNIPFSSTFAQWAGWVLPNDMPIGLIVDNTYLFLEVIEQLHLMGFDQDIWVIQIEKNRAAFVGAFDSMTLIDPEELGKHQPHSDSFYVIDVRTPEEWQSGHIPGAHHLELYHLTDSLKQLPEDRPITLVCRSGNRASLAASYLRKHGFLSAMNMRGGMQAWKQAGLPVKVGHEKITV